MAPVRRKSQGSIRCPHVKRNFLSQVTLEDWLLKLEGGALRQWKQRWCVLVDFCLFFYKAPHEGKVISSIVLPSYNINPCSTEDKVSKKYAFKAEHENMKTYYFAAEDKESMKKWMNAMSLATIMQNSGTAVCKDEDDSGFTSYPSHREPSNRFSSIHNTSSSCSEPLKQRSNSCGDRVGEMYLGSDDKYPNYYKSSLSTLSQTDQDFPMKQPLYANAPPKPKRLTQADGPGTYYSGHPFNHSRDFNAMTVGFHPRQVEYRYESDDNSVKYVPVDVDGSACVHLHSSYLSDDLISSPSEYLPSVCRVKQPRPHSADFLEKENECSSSSLTGYTSPYWENHQPQRPKSSLECYNRMVDSEEDYDFDNYREAVRVQADNFYANKSLMKNRSLHIPEQTKNVTKSDSGLNAHYAADSCFLNNNASSAFLQPCYQDHSKESRSMSHANQLCRGNLNSPSKPSSVESMQRLQEWKQRMLQSPLSRRNQFHVTSSNVTYFNRLKCAEPENQEQNCSTSTQDNGLHTHQRDMHAHPNESNCDGGEQLQHPNEKTKDLEAHHETGEKAEALKATDNAYQKNIMYCVDSENNEILFSYSNSLTNWNALTPIQSSHYPPQMHSFSTLPNVNDIGMETHLPTNEYGVEKMNKPKMDPFRKDPSSDENKQATYSSDDEDEMIKDCNLKELPPKEESHPGEKYFGDVFDNSSSDYVNIDSTLSYKDFNTRKVSTPETDTCNAGLLGNNAPLRHKCDQGKQQLPSLSAVAGAPELQRHRLDSHEKMEDAPRMRRRRRNDLGDETECDIKREDYYRASQIFYSSMRMKKTQQKSNVCVPCYSPQIKFNKIHSLDNDIGLPLPASKVLPKAKLANNISNVCVDMEDASRDCCNDSKIYRSDKWESKVDDITRNGYGRNVDSEELKCEKKGMITKEIKKSLTYEEMRGQVLRKLEAPPPNIVQERIKKFEKNQKETIPNQSKVVKCDLQYGNSRPVKENNSNNDCFQSPKPILQSDSSEIVAPDDSDRNSDDSTTVPLALSPLSSVLADLRKTADYSGNSSCASSLKKDSSLRITDDGFAENQNNDPHSKMSNDLNPSIEDAVYLPMSGGIKAIKEPEYVTMSGNKRDSSKANSNEEHVYNEPFSPPPSFLHDVYGKQKAKLFQYQMESSTSDDSSTENIYEKPIHSCSLDSSKIVKKEHAIPERNSISSSCLDIRSSNKNAFSCSPDERIVEAAHHYEQAHFIGVSVPDLLRLQEGKNSDAASDADDEASRDFDTAAGAAPSSYQTPDLDHFHSADANSSSSSSSFSTSARSSKLDTDRELDDHTHKRDSNLFPERLIGSISQNYPLHEKMSTANSVGGTLSHLESKSAHRDDCGKIIHVRKLRVYTKGKKPQVPRMYPLPFNLDEVESEKSDLEIQKLNESVAYVSKADISNCSADDSVVGQSDAPPQVSYAPDIISSIREGEKFPLNKNSSKSNICAPYYYSDLYSRLMPPILDQLDLQSSSKCCSSLLNNIRPKSPCTTSRGDIGRKVNDIRRNLKGSPVGRHSDQKQLMDDKTKSNIGRSLDAALEVSESKYSHAEKNRYEAGSTLEKARTSSTMSHFKHRASTPDLNLYQYQLHEEPVYENILFQQPKRVSHSLEDINAIPELQQRQLTSGGPVYENIDFFNGPFKMNDSSPSFMLSHFSSPNAKKCFENSTKDAGLTTQTVVDLKGHTSEQDSKSCTLGERSNDSRTNLYLKKMDTLPDSPNRLEDYKYLKMTSSLETPIITKHNGNDTDSNSNATSSCDEASADSDYKHRLLVEQKVDTDHELGSNIPVLGVLKREAMHLKKLVQQSHGLMCKGKRLSVSAGDLLGKTHEELVLLLIQLRRNQSKILKAKEKLGNKLTKRKKDGFFQIENQQYEELSNQIIHLEKQYKVTQPLVTLVDNMVKLGSLYGSNNRRSFSLPILGSSYQEDSSSDSHIASYQTNIPTKFLKKENQLQKPVGELNTSEDRFQFQSETNCMSTLQQDKEMLEHTLFGMKIKILDQQDRPVELKKLSQQQRMIEKELMRVKRLLNNSAKKIESATSKNDQMEQEILHLRQILQQALKTGSSTEMNSSHQCRADLEAELVRLQSVLDELANHRHEINNTVEKLKTEACSSRSKGSEVRASPTGVAGSAPLPLRKKHHCIYLETDLDTMITRDLAVLNEKEVDDIPLYVNAKEITLPNEEMAPSDAVSSSNVNNALSSSFKVNEADSELSLLDINEADERMKRFYGILPKEKPSEIKTVRIVKRQSERRSRERDKKKVSYDEQSSVWITEEPDVSSDDYLEIEETSNKKTYQASEARKMSLHLCTGSSGHQMSAHERLFGSSVSSKNSGLFQVQNTKKSKRRHYTVSGYQYMLDPQFSQYFSERPRSRDDVDMERCLRTANTPDIVRSTIKKNEVFDEKLIDRELGLPQKIDIPERYVEIEPEHLSVTEKLQRSLKAENICKMLTETTA